MDIERVKALLNAKVEEYEKVAFIENDPICIPHSFSKKQDIEISGFFAATLAWGNRTTIINSCKKLMNLMDNSPHQFIKQHQASDLKPFLHFVHRTFNATDVLYFISWLHHFYRNHRSLEDAFFPSKNVDVKDALSHFHQSFFSIKEAPDRTRKHVSTPERKSACKRLNMFLRWMIRKDSPVDFGLWSSIAPSQLFIPLDTHSAQVARKLGLLLRKQNDWYAVVELTEKLKTFDSVDPVRYDFALFALGAEERYQYRNRNIRYNQ